MYSIQKITNENVRFLLFLPSLQNPVNYSTVNLYQPHLKCPKATCGPELITREHEFHPPRPPRLLLRLFKIHRARKDLWRCTACKGHLFIPDSFSLTSLLEFKQFHTPLKTSNSALTDDQLSAWPGQVNRGGCSVHFPILRGTALPTPSPCNPKAVLCTHLFSPGPLWPG